MLPLNGPENREKEFRILVRFSKTDSFRGQGADFGSKKESATIKICKSAFHWNIKGFCVWKMLHGKSDS